MPIIASQSFTINITEKEKIKILFRDNFKNSKCIHLPSLSSSPDDLDKMRNVAMQLVGEKAIECDEDTCCMSNTYFDFVGKLGEMK